MEKMFPNLFKPGKIGTLELKNRIAKAPQLMGDCSSVGKELRASIFSTMMPAPKMKLTQTDSFVVFFQYSP